MGLIERKHEPSPLELKIFGLIVATLCGILGAIVLWRTDSRTAAGIIWGVGLTIAAAYYAVPGLRRTIYSMWMTAFYPVGWLISHVLLATVYYLVLTPIGLVARLFGHDPLRRSLDRNTTSYWTPHTQEMDAQRDFRQF